MKNKIIDYKGYEIIYLNTLGKWAIHNGEFYISYKHFKYLKDAKIWIDFLTA
jgi:hypothetical protein